MSYSLEQLRQDINTVCNVHSKTILDVNATVFEDNVGEECGHGTEFDDAAYQFVDNTEYYLLSKDTEVIFTEEDGVSFKNTFDARSFVTIDEDEGVVGFDYGYFGHIKGSENYGKYDPGCLVDVDKLKKSLVPITREQYDSLRELKDAADEEACENEQAMWKHKANGLSDDAPTLVTVVAKQFESECDKIFEQNGIDTQVNSPSKTLAARFDSVSDEETIIAEDTEYER